MMKAWLCTSRCLYIICWILGLGGVFGALNKANATQPHIASPCAQVVRWAHVYEASHPLHKWALWVSTRFQEETKGRYHIVVYPSSVLGKEGHLNQSLSLGTVDIIYTGISFAAQTYPPLGLSEMPYIFNDLSHWQRFFKSKIFHDMSENYSQLAGGSRIVSATYYGTRHMTANRRIDVPSDIQGLKIRVPGASVYHILPLSLGAKPSPIAFSEVYLALQQGVVDAQENPLPTIAAKKLYEVQSHINLTAHILGSILTISNNQFLSSLSDEDRILLVSLLEEAAASASRDIASRELQLSQWFTDNGIVVHSLNTEPFKRATRQYLSTHFPQKSQGVYDEIQSL